MPNHSENRITQTDLLPILINIVRRELGASKEQLVRLQNGKNTLLALDKKNLDKIISSYAKKSEEVIEQKAICAGWKGTHSTTEECTLAGEIQSVLSEIENVYKQILFLTEYYKNNLGDEISNLH